MSKDNIENNSKSSGLFTAVDIGTDSIKVIIGGRATSSDDKEVPDICIYGTGRIKSNNAGSENMPIDIRKGDIINYDKVRHQIEQAIEEAETESGMDVLDTELYVGITGQNTRSENVESTISIADSHVSDEDLIHALRIAHEKCVTEVPGTTLQILMRYFKTEHGITYDVKNQMTRNLHAYVQAAVCTSQQKYSSMHLLMRDATGKEPHFFYVPTLPGYAGMDEAEREKNSLSIDIGAGLTSFSINTRPGMMDFGHIPVGCNHIENDLMLGLDIDWEAARHILRRLGEIGSAQQSEDGPTTVRLKHKGGQRKREVPLESITTIVNSRLEEIFLLVKKELIARNSWDKIRGHVFLSGGGALIPDIREQASRALEIDAEYAKPGSDIINSTSNKDILSDPRWIVPIGMLRMAISDDEIDQTAKDVRGEKNSVMGTVSKLFKTIINW